MSVCPSVCLIARPRPGDPSPDRSEIAGARPPSAHGVRVCCLLLQAEAGLPVRGLAALRLLHPVLRHRLRRLLLLPPRCVVHWCCRQDRRPVPASLMAACLSLSVCVTLLLQARRTSGTLCSCSRATERAATSTPRSDQAVSPCMMRHYTANHGRQLTDLLAYGRLFRSRTTAAALWWL